MNPRPLGYEPYDESLCRLGLSLADTVTSADRTDPVSPCRLRLPRLMLSRGADTVLIGELDQPSLRSLAIRLQALGRQIVDLRTDPPTF